MLLILLKIAFNIVVESEGIGRGYHDSICDLSIIRLIGMMRKIIWINKEKQIKTNKNISSQNDY
ncbi:MAG TPA: hypothetical protein VNU45_19955 [Rummeliibacillus sp.]|nr:hypothetical protein [Rummeliibacillus sp.]